jgi:hypothetical protein
MAGGTGSTPGSAVSITKQARHRMAAGRLVLAGAMTVLAVLMLSQGAVASAGPRVTAPSWHLQFPTVPSASIGSGLSGVSCTSADACTAVGSYESTGSVFTTFAESWNGSSWTIENTPSDTVSNLNAVACLSASSCIAVGDVLSGVGIDTLTLAERWNGTTWTTLTTPTPKGAARAFLIAVSCTSATLCEAVGMYNKKSSTQLPFAEKWNGTSWRIQGTPKPSGSTELNGVSCTSGSSCVTVGDYDTSSGTEMLAERWNGTNWAIQSTPNPGGGSDSSLGGVSCTAAAACTATGSYFNGTAQASLAERWNGTSWTTQSTPNRVDATATNLVAVSCPSASECVAAGSATQGHMTKTDAEKWNGSAWKLQDPGIPAGSTESGLMSVSCPSTSDCTAVGFYANGSGTEISLAAQYS